MNLRPVIERELRAEARHLATYYFRPVGAGAALVAAGEFLLGPMSGARPGPELFAVLHQFLFLCTWMLVPLMTADCVSREKREGTIGLLFLTPLNAREILMAKGLAQGLRGATVCVAAVPVLMLPFVLGGLSWEVVASSLLVNASTFLWALAAGLLASVLSRSAVRALSSSLVWSAVFLAILSLVTGLGLNQVISALGGPARALPSAEWLAGMGLLALWHPQHVLDAVLPSQVHRLWLMAGLVVVLISLLGVLLAWRIGARRLARAWQESPRTREREELEKRFCRPRFGAGLFRSWMRRSLERNPVGWLERRRWTSRVARWGWLGLLSIVCPIALMNYSTARDLYELQNVLAFLLMGAIAITSASSLRQERETGVLELLLTTPLRPEQIMAGRLRGIWSQFVASAVFVCFVWLVLDIHPSENWSRRLNPMWMLAVSCLALPAVGLWLSLGPLPFFASLMLTIAGGYLGPMALAEGVGRVVNMAGGHSISLPLLLGVWAIGLAVGVWGVWQMRLALGRTGCSALMLVLVTMAGAALFDASWVDEMLHGFSRRRGYLRHWSPSTLATCFQLGAGGFACRQLLRNLRRRRFVFQV